MRVGKLDVVEIGLPGGVDDDVPLSLMTDANMRPMLPVRPSDAHKGSFGRTMVVAGSLNYIGAAYLAGSAATRVGSGLGYDCAASVHTDGCGWQGDRADIPAARGVLARGGARHRLRSDVLGALDDYNGLLIGCGMGQAAGMQGFVEGVLYSGDPSSEKKLPQTVVDADGLNTLARTERTGGSGSRTLRY